MSQTWGAPQSRMTLWGEKEQRSGRISGGNARRSKAEFVTTRGWFDWLMKMFPGARLPFP
ncbi:hypothetical protein TQ39_01320 [Ruthenibacterium lactatiformans]|uniref:Uncharacterized protein n=1 Tax=Ruthenibacterium lactatiformans TaxID=1550024 RepID=A0A0D8J3D9_9FIRM|nr:hypothetical protein TQ39_01320 [Ruthenibacterium lactatiformans]